jgi:hypothetical protein
MRREEILKVKSIIDIWGKKIVIYSVLAGIITGIASFFTDNTYRATTVFYPGNLVLASPNPVGYGEKDRYPFGKGDDLDRLFAVAQSQEIADYLIQKFELAKHYKAKTETFEGKGKVVEKFRKHFEVSKNKFEAIELSFSDTDRELAAKVANEGRTFIASKISLMVRGSAVNSLAATEAGIKKQEALASALADTIKKLKIKNNIIHTTAQGSELGEIIVQVDNELAGSRAKALFYKDKAKYLDSLIKYQALVKGYESQKQLLKQNGHVFVSVVNEIFKLEVEYDKLVTQVALDKERMKGMAAMNNGEFTAVHIVDEAKVPLKKSGPFRSLMVIGAMVLVGVSILFLLILSETFWIKELFSGKS